MNTLRFLHKPYNCKKKRRNTSFESKEITKKGSEREKAPKQKRKDQLHVLYNTNPSERKNSDVNGRMGKRVRTITDKLEYYFSQRKSTSFLSVALLNKQNRKPVWPVDKYTCSMCTEAFCSQNVLEQHLTYDHRPRPTCKQCSRIFDCRRKLIEHEHVCGGDMRKQTPGGVVSFVCDNEVLLCNRCENPFPSLDALRTHQALLRKMKPIDVQRDTQCDARSDVMLEVFVKNWPSFRRAPPRGPCELNSCSHCGKAFQSDFRLRAHENICKRKLVCPFCLKHCRSELRLRDHLNICAERLKFTTSKPPSPTKIPCELCPMRFTLPALHLKHLRLSHRTRRCQQCKVIYSIGSIHNCQKARVKGAFVQKKLLNENRLFQCKYCSFTHLTYDAFSAHLRKKHNVRRKRDPFISTCPHCFDCFASETDVNAHVQSSCTKRTCFCSFCGGSCGMQLLSHLNSCMELHATNIAPFKRTCHVCGCVRTNKLYLFVHLMEKHTTLFPFACESCEFQCASWRQLAVHLKRNHSVVNRNVTGCILLTHMKRHGFASCAACKKIYLSENDHATFCGSFTETTRDVNHERLDNKSACETHGCRDRARAKSLEVSDQSDDGDDMTLIKPAVPSVSGFYENCKDEDTASVSVILSLEDAKESLTSLVVSDDNDSSSSTASNISSCEKKEIMSESQWAEQHAEPQHFTERENEEGKDDHFNAEKHEIKTWMPDVEKRTSAVDSIAETKGSEVVDSSYVSCTGDKSTLECTAHETTEPRLQFSTDTIRQCLGEDSIQILNTFRVFPCNTCGVLFDEKRDLHAHVKGHNASTCMPRAHQHNIPNYPGYVYPHMTFNTHHLNAKSANTVNSVESHMGYPMPLHTVKYPVAQSRTIYPSSINVSPHVAGPMVSGCSFLPYQQRVFTRKLASDQVSSAYPCFNRPPLQQLYHPPVRYFHPSLHMARDVQPPAPILTFPPYPKPELSRRAPIVNVVKPYNTLQSRVTSLVDRGKDYSYEKSPYPPTEPQSDVIKPTCKRRRRKQERPRHFMDA